MAIQGNKMDCFVTLAMTMLHGAKLVNFASLERERSEHLICETVVEQGGTNGLLRYARNDEGGRAIDGGKNIPRLFEILRH